MASKKRKYPGSVTPDKKNKSQTYIMAAMLFFLFGVAIGSVFLFQNRLSSKENSSTNELTEPTPYLSILDSMNNAENVDIKIERDGISPEQVKIKKDREYNFRIIKMPGSTCLSLKNSSLDYSLQLLNTATSYPIRIPTPGEYILECDEQDSKISIIVQ